MLFIPLHFPLAAITNFQSSIMKSHVINTLPIHLQCVNVLTTVVNMCKCIDNGLLMRWQRISANLFALLNVLITVVNMLSTRWHPIDNPLLMRCLQLTNHCQCVYNPLFTVDKPLSTRLQPVVNTLTTVVNTRPEIFLCLKCVNNALTTCWLRLIYVDSPLLTRWQTMVNAFMNHDQRVVNGCKHNGNSQSNVVNPLTTHWQPIDNPLTTHCQPINNPLLTWFTKMLA